MLVILDLVIYMELEILVMKWCFYIIYKIEIIEHRKIVKWIKTTLDMKNRWLIYIKIVWFKENYMSITILNFIRPGEIRITS